MLWTDGLDPASLFQVYDMGSDDFASISLSDTSPPTTA